MAQELLPEAVGLDASLEDGETTGQQPTRKGLVSHIKTEALSYSQRLAQTSPLWAEFAGSLLQGLVWNCTELGKESSKGGEWKPCVLGLMLMVNTYSFASVSGAHLNPAVSLSVGLSNMGNWAQLGKFMVVQFLGSVAGVALSCVMYGKVAHEAIGPRAHFSNSDCFMVESVYTAMIALVYLSVTLSRSNNSVKAGNQFYGLAIGFAMAAGCWAAEEVSGAIMNPGLALAIDLQNISDGFGSGFFYIMAQIAGAGVAALAYRVMRPNESANVDNDLFSTSQTSKGEGVTMPKLVAEGVGTALIVFTFGMSTLSTKYHDERPFAAAAALLSLHYALADVSGGHFNPAVTLSVMLSGRGKCGIKQGMAYIALQTVSAALAAGIFTAVNYPNTFPAIPKTSLDKYGWHPLIVVDAVYTCVVCYVALATITLLPAIRTPVKRNYYDGLAYGLSSAAGGFAMLNLLNSLANPALTLGTALSYAIVGEANFWRSLFVSSCGVMPQLAGAVVASCLFRFTHASYYRREALMGKDCGTTDCEIDAFSKEAYEGMSGASDDDRLPLLQAGDDSKQA